MNPITATVFGAVQPAWYPRRALLPAANGETGRQQGRTLRSWLRARGCDERTINQIAARRFSRGSFRPSDRAALLLDCAPELTPFADEAAS